MRTLLLFLASSSFAFITVAAEENKKVYTWTDDQGIIHYSDRPVSGKEAEILKQVENNNIATLAPKTNQWQQDYQENKKNKAKDQQLIDESSKQKQAYCQQLKDRIALFERGGRLYNKSVNGERSFYSDDEIAKELQQLNTEVKAKCR